MKECTQCGKCCLHYGDGGLAASAEEILAWETFNPDIARYVVDGKIWMDPSSGAQLARCPWLEEAPQAAANGANGANGATVYGCRIYADRPEDCRHYPTSIPEMLRDNCQMLEVRDLDDPRQAQIVLDRIMADSRPPLSRDKP